MSKILINENGKALMSADGRVYKTEPIDTLEALCNNTLTSYSNSNITKVRLYLFEKNTNLTSIDLPNATSIGQRAFSKCGALISVNAPQVQTIDGNAFEQCSLLTSVDFQNVKTLYSKAFDTCNSLISISFPQLTKIYDSVFRNCTGLTDIYLGANQVVTLSNTNVFDGVTAGLKIHVRAEYADQYTDATNWSSLIAEGKIVIVGDYSD